MQPCCHVEACLKEQHEKWKEWKEQCMLCLHLTCRTEKQETACQNWIIRSRITSFAVFFYARGSCPYKQSCKSSGLKHF